MEKITQKVKRQKMDDVTLFKRFERPSLLSKALMTIDGFLLSTLTNMGSCIPDKLVDKKELVKELADEMYGYGKTLNKVKNLLLDMCFWCVVSLHPKKFMNFQNILKNSL